MGRDKYEGTVWSDYCKGALTWYSKLTWESVHAWNLILLCNLITWGMTFIYVMHLSFYANPFANL